MHTNLMTWCCIQISLCINWTVGTSGQTGPSSPQYFSLLLAGRLHRHARGCVRFRPCVAEPPTNGRLTIVPQKPTGLYTPYYHTWLNPRLTVA
jgi:hypothetical protein